MIDIKSKPKRTWKHEGRNFVVEISCHIEAHDEHAPYRWCTYAYVYPKHPLFDSFKVHGTLFDQPYIDGAHSYTSFFKVHRKPNGDITSFQIGWDYNHHGDDWFCESELSGAVFSDANTMIAALTEMESGHAHAP